MTNEELCIAIQSDKNNKQKIEELYFQNIGLLQSICNRISKSSGYEFEDLLQESYFCFVKAAENWNADQGVSFSTYATTAIYRYLLQYVRKTHSIIRKPVYKESLIGKYKQFLNEYQKQYGKEPSDEELCNELAINADALALLKSDAYCTECLSLSASLPEDDGTNLADLIPDPVDQYECVETRIIQGELAEKIWAAVSKLKEEQQTVIKQHYVDGKSIASIARENHWKYHKTKRNHKTALDTLRRKNRRELKKFFEIYGIGLKRTGLQYWKHTGTSSTEYAALKMLDKWENDYSGEEEDEI